MGSAHIPASDPRIARLRRFGSFDAVQARDPKAAPIAMADEAERAAEDGVGACLSFWAGANYSVLMCGNEATRSRLSGCGRATTRRAKVHRCRGNAEARIAARDLSRDQAKSQHSR